MKLNPNKMPIIFVIDMLCILVCLFLFYIHVEEYWFMMIVFIFSGSMLAWLRWSCAYMLVIE